MLDATDVLKGNEHGSWKKDLAYVSAFADSFQKFDVDSVSMDTFAELKSVVEADWFSAANFKGEKLLTALFKFINEMFLYGKALTEVQPKRQMIDLNEVALSAMVTSFSTKKDEYMVLSEQIAQLEKSGKAERDKVIREKLELGQPLPTSDLMIENTRSIEKRKEALVQDIQKLDEKKSTLIDKEVTAEVEQYMSGSD